MDGRIGFFSVCLSSHEPRLSAAAVSGLVTGLDGGGGFETALDCLAFDSFVLDVFNTEEEEGLLTAGRLAMMAAAAGLVTAALGVLATLPVDVRLLAESELAGDRCTRAVADLDLPPSPPSLEPAPGGPPPSKSFLVSRTMSGAGISFSVMPVRIPEDLRL